MIYGYLRVSTDEQDSNNQKLGVCKKAESLGLSVDDWIIDDGISGTKEPEKRLLGKLMKYVLVPLSLVALIAGALLGGIG